MELTRIYLDYAATAPMRPEVKNRLMSLWGGESWAWANSAASHSAGAESAALLESARSRLGKALAVKASEIVFTGSATESNNWFLRSALNSNLSCAISSVEHSSVREFGKLTERVRTIPVDHVGQLRLDELEKALKAGVRFVSVLTVNNETGIRMRLDPISKLCREHGAIFHTDAAQAVGHGRRFMAADTGADLITFNGHKLGGPKGISAAYIRSGVDVKPFMIGGGHEGGRRSGTVASELADGFALAFELSERLLPSEAALADVHAIRARLRSQLAQRWPDRVRFNESNDPTLNAGHVLSVTFSGVHSKTLVQELNRKKIYCSAGSACAALDTCTSNQSSLVNSVMRALGHADESAHHVRFSFGYGSRVQDADSAVERLAELL